MKEFTYVITDPVGIHARPAGILVKEVKGLGSDVVIERVATGKSAPATKLMALMGLGIKQGDEVKVTVEGGDEGANCEKIEAFFKENF